MTPALRIGYFGTPEFAVPGLRRLIASPHQVVVVVSQPDRPKGRGNRVQPTATKLVAEAEGIPVLQPTRLKDPALHDRLRDFSLDLGVVAAYGRIIPDAILTIPRLGLINIHGSLLPRYRGAAPVHRAVIEGDAETGVSIMRVVTELDAGPVFATATRLIGPDETTPQVSEALATLGAEVLLDVVHDLAQGTAVETPQDHDRATYAPKIERAEGLVDWTLPARRLHDLVRGLQPWPLVTAVIDGESYRVHRTELTDERTTAQPGTLIRASGDELAVAAGDGRVVRIAAIQPEAKRVMSAREFLAGRRISAGAVVTSR